MDSSNGNAQMPVPRTMQEAVSLGYEYSGGDSLVGGEFISGNEMLWQGTMEFTVFGDNAAPGSLLPCIKVKATARFSFESIEPNESAEEWEARLPYAGESREEWLRRLQEDDNAT